LKPVELMLLIGSNLTSDSAELNSVQRFITK
jgi:hypothetical protein